VARGDPQFNVRLSQDLKDFIAEQARLNGASQNSEVVRAIRERMDRVSTRSAGPAASTGESLATSPADAGNSAALAGGTLSTAE
jgi:hypothetical protein